MERRLEAEGQALRQRGRRLLQDPTEGRQGLGVGEHFLLRNLSLRRPPGPCVSERLGPALAEPLADGGGASAPGTWGLGASEVDMGGSLAGGSSGECRCVPNAQSSVKLILRRTLVAEEHSSDLGSQFTHFRSSGSGSSASDFTELWALGTHDTSYAQASGFL